LEKLDATQEREGRDLDVANRLEATGLLFEVFARHAQRPPVSPKQRETMIFTLVELVPTSTGQGISYAAAAEYVDDLIARFSLPVLDMEKVARFLYSLDPAIQGWNGDPYGYSEPNAKGHRDRAQQWAERLIEALP